MMRDQDDLFAALDRSAFRRRFKLRDAERSVLARKGLPTILGHARQIIVKRLAPYDIPNDGRQTPFKGHPVFVAQHATATCCRGCLLKWHGIAKGRALSDEEVQYAINVIARWLRSQGVSSETGETLRSDEEEQPSLWNPLP